MNKVLSLILAAIMCITMLAACGNRGGDASGGDSTESSSVESVIQSEASGDENNGATPTEDIAVSALAEYYVVRAEVSSTVECSNKLNTAISDKLSVKTKGIRTDFVMEGSDDYAVHELEILIGATNREESGAFIAELKQGEYGYKVVGDKIVIAGLPEENTALAVDKFISDVIDTYKSDNKTFIAKDSKFIQKIEYKFDSLKINGTDISEFEIVYKNTHGSNEEIIAKEISEVIGSLCGVNLKTSNKSSSAKQIIVYDGKAEHEEYQGGGFGLRSVLRLQRTDLQDRRSPCPCHQPWREGGVPQGQR